MPRKPNPELREFILRNVQKHPNDIGSLAAGNFAVSRTTSNNYLRDLVEEGLLEASGKTNAKKFSLKPIKNIVERIDITPDMEENLIWQAYFLPAAIHLKENVRDICQYGFNEMFNNVMDHSESSECLIWYTENYSDVTIGVQDYGVGIFEKIKRDFKLLDSRHALLELSKGKLTSDDTKHTGEGIFFTSRAFDFFSIYSFHLFYSRTRNSGGEGLMEVEKKEDELSGTLIVMRIKTDANQTLEEIFAKYMDDDYRFSRTHVFLSLVKYEGEQLVSRSQARRLLARVEKFDEVVLDFVDISMIGQAFADEIFRVFQNMHPGTHIFSINTTEAVFGMIEHARANAREKATEQGDLFNHAEADTESPAESDGKQPEVAEAAD